MGKLISWILNIARIVLLAIIVIAVWPTAVALLEAKITWENAVDSLFSDFVITMLIGAFVLTILISIFRNEVARWAVSIAAAAVVICLITGTITLERVSESVDAYKLAGEAQKAIDDCNVNVTVEEFGGRFRAVMKDPSHERVVGYVAETAEGVATLLDVDGKTLTCGA